MRGRLERIPDSGLVWPEGEGRLTGRWSENLVKRDLAAAGYRGEPVTVLGVAGTGNIAPISEVGVDQLRNAGMNIDLQMMDVGTMSRRRISRDTSAKGGWDVYFTLLEGLTNANPATHAAIRGDGKSGIPGWPISPELETLRDAWLVAGDLAAEKRIAEKMQLQMWN